MKGQVFFFALLGENVILDPCSSAMNCPAVSSSSCSTCKSQSTPCLVFRLAYMSRAAPSPPPCPYLNSLCLSFFIRTPSLELTQTRSTRLNSATLERDQKTKYLFEQ